MNGHSLVRLPASPRVGEAALFRGALRAAGQGCERSERHVPPDKRSASGVRVGKQLDCLVLQSNRLIYIEKI